MATTPFQDFVNLELPKRLGTNADPTQVQQGLIPVTTGIGLLTTLTDIDTILQQSNIGINGSAIYNAKNLPVRADGTVVLPNKPLGDIIHNKVIVHLNSGAVVEFVDVVHSVVGVEDILTLPTTEYNYYKSQIASVSLSYLISN
jgi:hypothetical protein